MTEPAVLQDPTATVPLTVIIPARDAAATIRPCLESVLRDLPGNAEVILADHHSRDDTLSIARSLADPRLLIRVVDARTVGGVRNRAADVARGAVLAFVDADCTVPPGHFARLLETFDNPAVGVTGAPYALPPSTRWIERAWHALHQPADPAAIKYIPAGNLAIRREAFRQAGGFDEALTSGEDTELCQRLGLLDVRVRVVPSLEIPHLGNPKSLGAFYRQQRWHAVGMLGTARRNPTEPMTLALLAFWGSLLAAIGLLAFAGRLGWGAVVAAPVMVLAIPFAAAAYRSLQSRNLRHLLTGTVLYLVYFLARTSGALRILSGRVAGTATSRR